MQTTIAQKARFRGVGLHSGAAVRLAILPAPADHGIVFVRTDLDGAGGLCRRGVVIAVRGGQLVAPDDLGPATGLDSCVPGRSEP